MMRFPIPTASPSRLVFPPLPPTAACLTRRAEPTPSAPRRRRGPPRACPVPHPTPPPPTPPRARGLVPTAVKRRRTATEGPPAVDRELEQVTQFDVLCLLNWI
ncbi:unnamed protein product [Alopecurus aequalis]